MGITGLLNITQPIQKPIHIKEYEGRRVGVDANAWLHIAAFTCAKELAMGESTTAYLNYFMKQIDMLLFFKVIPIVVFDGDSLPIENVAKEQRRINQEEARSAGMHYLRRGDRKNADVQFQKAVHITPEMIQTVIKALSDKKVRYIRAPFDAEAQLAYLCQNKMVDAVIAETSNLIVYGCPTILFKLNHFGEANQVQLKDLGNIKEMDFSNWTMDQFRHMCILSGCDYLPSLKGIGLKVAYKLLAKFKTIDKVFANLCFGKIKTNPEYEKKFKLVSDVFKYQFVYNPCKKTIVRMIEPDNHEERYPHLGELDTIASFSNTMPSSPSSSTVISDQTKLVNTTTITTKKRALTALEQNTPSNKNKKHSIATSSSHQYQDRKTSHTMSSSSLSSSTSSISNASTTTIADPIKLTNTISKERGLKDSIQNTTHKTAAPSTDDKDKIGMKRKALTVLEQNTTNKITTSKDENHLNNKKPSDIKYKYTNNTPQYIHPECKIPVFLFKSQEEDNPFLVKPQKNTKEKKSSNNNNNNENAERPNAILEKTTHIKTLRG